MSNDPRNPRAMTGFIGNGIHVLESVKGVPKEMFSKCAAMMLLSTREFAFFLTGTRGAGVAMVRHADKWSLPFPVLMQGTGLGASIGGADREVLVLLNVKDSKKLVDISKGGVAMGANFGFVVGKTGVFAESDINLSDDGKLARSTTYSYSKGLLLTAEINGCTVDLAPDVLASFYGEAYNVESILNGTAKIPSSDEFVAKLHAAVKKAEEEAKPALGLHKPKLPSNVPKPGIPKNLPGCSTNKEEGSAEASTKDDVDMEEAP